MSTTLIVPLLPTSRDRDRVSERALPVARVLARRLNGPLVLVSVLEDAGDDPEVVRGAHELARHDLKRVAASLPEHTTSTVVRAGDAATEIIATAASVDQPLIVMSSHARTGVRRMLIGSVAFRVVHEAPCPVVIVPIHLGERTSWDVDRVVVPLGGQLAAEQLLDQLLVVLGPGLNVHLVDVIEPLVRRSGVLVREYYALGREVASKHLADVAARCAERGYRVTWEVRVGLPEQEIARIVREQGASLVALTTHGRTGFGRLVLGSTAEYLAHAGDIPLLLVRPSAAVPVLPEPDWHDDVHDVANRAARLNELRAGDIMVAPVVTVALDTSLEEVAATMLGRRVGCVPVVDGAGHLVGIVTETDFSSEKGLPFSIYRVPQVYRALLAGDGVERLLAAGRRMTARQIMSTPVATAEEDDPAWQIARQMADRDINHVPVMRDGIPVGIIARHDLLRLLASG
jgi:nucleotide-binding universal stress UspA family protein